METARGVTLFFAYYRRHLIYRNALSSLFRQVPSGSARITKLNAQAGGRRFVGKFGGRTKLIQKRMLVTWRKKKNDNFNSFRGINRRGNPPWLPGLFAAPVVCVWRGGRVVWILRGPGAICALGQAQGPAPTGFDAILNRRGNPLWLPCYPQRRRRGRRPSRFIGRVIVRDDQSFWRRLIALANDQHWSDDGPGGDHHD